MQGVVMSTAMLPEPEWSARAEAWRRVGATDLLVDIGAASSALARVQANPELRDLWGESDDAGAGWRRQLSDLMARLAT